MITAYFSILRYVPDPLRREFVNVGAIVVVPGSGYISHRWAKSQYTLERVRRFAPTFAFQEFKAFSEFLNDITVHAEQSLYDHVADAFIGVPTASEAFLRELARTHCLSRLQFGEILTAEFDAEAASSEFGESLLSDLLERQVELAKPKRKKRGGTRIVKDLAKALREKELLGRDLDDHLVVADHLFVDSGLKFDFVLLNSSLHVVETIDLSNFDPMRRWFARQSTGAALMKLTEAKDRLTNGRDVRPYAVIRASSKQEKELEPELGLMRDLVRLFNFDSDNERRALLGELEKAARQPRLG